VGTDTLFQAASISKPVTAMAAMRLADEHRLSVDADINTILKSWHVPGSSRPKRTPAHSRSDSGREAAIERGAGAVYAAGISSV
jgi:CubicO group peptidase (beta-lactamase class C family)